MKGQIWHDSTYLRYLAAAISQRPNVDWVMRLREVGSYFGMGTEFLFGMMRALEMDSVTAAQNCECT